MSDVLDQTDIDSLLSAVAVGDIEEERSEGQVFSRSRRDLDSVEIKEYDFKRPERISKDQMRALQTLHDTFARNFGASLSGFLRTIVEVRVAYVEQMTYSEFTSGLPNPTSFNLVESDSLTGQLCLELSPLIIYPIIDRLLGGTNQDLFIPQRPMTQIETRLIQKVLERGTAALAEAWEGVQDIEFRLGEMESNPQIMQIVPPNEVVVVIAFEIKMTNRAGTMALCIPFNVIEPLIDDLSNQSWSVHGARSEAEHWDDKIRERLSSAHLQVAGVLAETTMTLADLRGLEPGDLIVTEKPATSPIVITAGGLPKYLGEVGVFKGRRALRVSRPIIRGDRL